MGKRRQKCDWEGNENIHSEGGALVQVQRHQGEGLTKWEGGHQKTCFFVKSIMIYQKLSLFHLIQENSRFLTFKNSGDGWKMGWVCQAWGRGREVCVEGGLSVFFCWVKMQKYAKVLVFDGFCCTAFWWSADVEMCRSFSRREAGGGAGVTHPLSPFQSIS